MLNKTDIAVIIMNGGKSSRVKHLTGESKCMYEIGGKPFIYYQLEYLCKFGFENVMVSTNKVHHKIHHYLRTYKDIPNLHFCCDENFDGTAIGFKNAIDALIKEWKDSSSFYLVLNGDTLHLIDFNSFLEFYFETLKNFPTSGLSVCKEIQTSEIYIERRLRFKTKDIYTGISIMPKQMVQQTVEKGMTIEHGIIDRHYFKAYFSDAPFIDIGTPETLLKTEQFIMEHLMNDNNENSSSD